MDETNKVFNKHIYKTQRQILRRSMPNPEQVVWSRIRRKQLNGCRFRRQYGVENYVIDFYSSELRLAIEIDGNNHFTNKTKKFDKKRQAFIESYGIKFLRFTNKEVTENIDGVLGEILKIVETINPT